MKQPNKYLKNWGLRMAIPQRNETTKITRRGCMGCGKIVSILCNETASIVSVRCPDCLHKFEKENKEAKQCRKIN